MSDSTVWGLILPVLSGPVKKAFYNSYSPPTSFGQGGSSLNHRALSLLKVGPWYSSQLKSQFPPKEPPNNGQPVELFPSQGPIRNTKAQPRAESGLIGQLVVD